MANTTKQFIRRSPSRTMQAARRVGIDIDVPKPHLPVTEQEETDLD